MNQHLFMYKTLT